MSTTALIPLAGAAAGVLASGAARSISGGLSFLAQLAGGETTSQAPVTETEPSSAEKLTTLDEKLQDFVRRLRERMLLGGMDPQQKLQLEQEPWGSIAVSDDHPQKDRVESILAADPLLSSEFHQLADEYRELGEASGQSLSRADSFQISIDATSGAAGFVR